MQQLVEAELVADVHGEDVERAENGSEQALGQLVGVHGGLPWSTPAEGHRPGQARLVRGPPSRQRPAGRSPVDEPPRH
jgi:hypothetical protein